MFVINEDSSIYVTRGDMAYIRVTCNKNGRPYTFQVGDVVRFNVCEKKKCENVVLQKDFPVTAVTQGVDIVLDGADTKIGEIISKPVDYWYEVVLNPFDNPQTIIGYDAEGTRVFRLYPEANDKPAPDPKPEVIKVIDTELDMVSERPVQNQAIARAFYNLQAGYQATHDAVAALHVTPQMFGAIGDGEADDTEAVQATIDSGYKIFIPEGKYKVDSIIIDNEVAIEGAGEKSVIITEGDGFVLSNSLAKKSFKNLCFDCNGGTAITIDASADTDAVNTLYITSCFFKAEKYKDHYAVKLFGENEPNIIDCTFYGCNGINIDGSINPNIANCVFRHSKVAIMYAHTGAINENPAYTCGLRVSGSTILGCVIGIKAVDTDSLQVNNCMIDYCDNPIIIVGQSGAFISNAFISSRYDNPAIYACGNNADTGRYGGNGLNTNPTEKLTISNSSVLTHVEDWTSSKVSAIVLKNCTHTIITNTHITWFTEDGVQLNDCIHTSLTDLHIACDSRMADTSTVYAINSYKNGSQDDDGSNHYSGINAELDIFYRYAKIRNTSNAYGFSDEVRGTVVVASGNKTHTVTIETPVPIVGAVASLSRTDYAVGINCSENTVTFTFDRQLEDNIRINYIVYCTR